MAEQGRESDNLTASFIASSDMIYDFYCEICTEFNKHLEATGFCVECSDYLCTDCVKAHKINKLSRNHVVQTKGQMPRQKPSPPPQAELTEEPLTEKCDTHPDRVVEYYCRSDNCLACPVCLVKHRHCDEFGHISDISKHLLDSQDYQKLTNSLTKLNTKSNDIIQDALANTSQAEKLCADVTTALHELRTKVNQAFDKLQNDVEKQTDTIKFADQKKMKDIGDKGKAVLTETETISNELQTLQNKNQLGQLFVRMIKLDDRVRALHNILDEMSRSNNVTTYRFEPERTAQEFIDKPDAIGKLSVQASKPQVSVSSRPEPLHMTLAQKIPPSQRLPAGLTISTASTCAPPTSTQHKDVKSMRPKKPDSTSNPPAQLTEVKVASAGTINVRTASKTIGITWITGSALLPGNKLILADNCTNKIKLLNLQTSKITLKLGVLRPWDVAVITKDQVAVTLRYVNKIAFVKVTSILTLDREISVDGACTGIVHNNGKLIVAFKKPVKIEIMGLDGKVEKKIECSSMFVEPSHIALSPGHDAIYVTDNRGHCVKRLSLDGKEEIVYENKQLHRPRGVIVDQQDRVIVCGGGESGNIHLLTADLTKIKLLVDEIYEPASLSLCHNTGRLYVGSNNVNVYQLSHIIVNNSQVRLKKFEII